MKKKAEVSNNLNHQNKKHEDIKSQFGPGVKVIKIDATSPENLQKSIANIINGVESGEIQGTPYDAYDDDDEEDEIDINASEYEKATFVNNIMSEEFYKLWNLLYKTESYEKITEHDDEIYHHISESVYDSVKEAQKYFKNPTDVKYCIIHDEWKSCVENVLCNTTLKNTYEVEVMDPLDHDNVLCSKKYTSEFSRYIFGTSLVYSKTGICGDGKFNYITIDDFPNINTTMEDFKSKITSYQDIMSKWPNIRGTIFSFVSNTIYDENGKVLHRKSFPMVYDIMHINFNEGTDYYSLITPYFTTEKERKLYGKYLKDNVKENSDDDDNDDMEGFFNAI